MNVLGAIAWSHRIDICVSQSSPLAWRSPFARAVTMKNAPGSLADGLEMFRTSHPRFVLVEINCWAPGMRLLFADGFFDVLAAVQKDISDSGEHGARVWPFHMTDGTAPDGAVDFLIGIWCIDDDDAASMVQDAHLVDKVYDSAANFLEKHHASKEREGFSEWKVCM